MAFFKSRSAAKEANPRQTDSVEAMRTRARHRLIGATLLVVVGVVGFPIVFDTQPRPIAVDIPIEIPDRNQARPLPVPAPAPAAVSSSARVTTPPAPAVVASQHNPVAAAPVAPVQAPAATPPVAKAQATPEPKVEAKATAKPEPKPEPKVAAVPVDDGSKAKALLEASTAKPVAAEGRFVVQVGAFADPAKARETRARVERAGLKTYTHVAETKAGRRIRVRVGPFATRGEADKAASKIKGLDLPAAILTL